MGYLLDLLARRYPNKRPSDFIDGLDGWQALQYDTAIAIKYSTLEKEEAFTHTEALLSALDNVMRVQGAKIPKRKPSKSVIVPYNKNTNKETDVPSITDLINDYSGGLTVLDMKGIK